MVFGKKQSGRPTHQNRKRQPRQMTAQVVVCSISVRGKERLFAGKNACTRCGRRGKTIDACQCTQNAKCFNCCKMKTGHFSNICMSHSAHAQSRAQSRARPRVQIKSKHVDRHVSGSEEDPENEYAYTTHHHQFSCLLQA